MKINQMNKQTYLIHDFVSQMWGSFNCCDWGEEAEMNIAELIEQYIEENDEDKKEAYQKLYKNKTRRALVNWKYLNSLYNVNYELTRTVDIYDA
jgi:hypothetical protein